MGIAKLLDEQIEILTRRNEGRKPDQIIIGWQNIKMLQEEISVISNRPVPLKLTEYRGIEVVKDSVRALHLECKYN